MKRGQVAMNQILDDMRYLNHLAKQFPFQEAVAGHPPEGGE